MHCTDEPGQVPILREPAKTELNAYPFKIATIGGTFDALHDGHKEYILAAYNLAPEVYIFISSDKLARQCKSYFVVPYALRTRRVINFLSENNLWDRTSIYQVESHDKLIEAFLSPAIQKLRGKNVVALVAPDYESLFRGINVTRAAKGMHDITLKIKERLRDANNIELSTTRIRTCDTWNIRKYYPNLDNQLVAKLAARICAMPEMPAE